MYTQKSFDNALGIYKNLDAILNNLPEVIPLDIARRLRDAILNDAELKEMMRNIENRRPPKYLLIGSTGHGKSSLVNAILGIYKAKVSSIDSGTRANEKFDVLDRDGRVAFSILDSRGINESMAEDSSAEEQLLQDMDRFRPDVAIYVHKAKERAGMKPELEFLSKVAGKYSEGTRDEFRLPVIVVLTQADELDPSSQKDPENYPQSKLENIEKARSNVEILVGELDVDVKGIIVVSSLMEYQESFERLNGMTEQERADVPFDDYRYKIEELKGLIIDSIPDITAQMGAISGIECKRVLEKLCRKFTHSFAGIAASIAAVPIPVGDVFILCALEAVLVMLIAAFAGREVSFKAAGELLVGFGGAGAIGFGAKIAAQQLAKLFPQFGGNFISATIATTGVEIIGNTATKYYFS